MRLFALSILLFALTACGGTNAGDTNSAASSALRSSEASIRKECLNLNRATSKELEPLPGIGEAMARKIIEYREQNGPFQRPEEVIIIEGFSERKYRAIADLICAY